MLDENYIHIDGWMINRLKLKGNELLAYAIVYGFTQDNETWFKGSSKYIAEALQVSRPTAIKALDSLVKKELLFKRQENINDVLFNRYKVNLQAIKKLDGGYKESLQGGYKESLQGGYKESLQGGYKESLHSNNIKELKENSNNKRTNKESYFPQDEKLNEAFKDFVDMRKKIKKPMTDRAIDLSVKTLEKLSLDTFGIMDNDKAIEIINQSILHGWLTFYPLKEEQPQKQQSYKRASGGIDWDNV